MVDNFASMCRRKVLFVSKRSHGILGDVYYMLISRYPWMYPQSFMSSILFRSLTNNIPRYTVLVYKFPMTHTLILRSQMNIQFSPRYRHGQHVPADDRMASDELPGLDGRPDGQHSPVVRRVHNDYINDEHSHLLYCGYVSVHQCEELLRVYR